MMASDPPRARRSSRKSDPRTLSRFVEELSWLLASYDELDFKALGQLSARFAEVARHTSVLSRSARSETSRELVGVLPSFFLDVDLFPANEDIVEFSQMVLGIGIPRWQKKSKHELIGHIVCHTDTASPEKLARVVAALDEAWNERGTARRKLAIERKSGRNWNEVVQSLLRDEL